MKTFWELTDEEKTQPLICNDNAKCYYKFTNGKLLAFSKETHAEMAISGIYLDNLNYSMWAVYKPNVIAGNYHKVKVDRVQAMEWDGTLTGLSLIESALGVTTEYCQYHEPSNRVWTWRIQTSSSVSEFVKPCQVIVRTDNRCFHVLSVEEFNNKYEKDEA